MRNSRFLVLSALLLSVVGTVAIGAENPTESSAMWERGTPVEVTAGSALAVSGKSALVGLEAGFGALLLPDMDLHVGADVGTFFTTGPFATVLTLFPQVYRKWFVSDAVALRAGFAMGAVISTGAGLSAMRFGAWLKPGLDAKIDRDVYLNFEPKIGFIGSSFAFVPQLGITWFL